MKFQTQNILRKRKDVYVGIKTKVYCKTPASSPTDNLKKRVLQEEKKAKVQCKNKVLKRNKKVLEDDEEMFTVVRGLKGFIRDDVDANFKFEIEQHVLVVSSLSIEASLMIYKYYSDQLSDNPNFDMSVKPDFRQFFTCLKEKNIGATGDKMRA